VLCSQGWKTAGQLKHNCKNDGSHTNL
jgi:hypothetical protein